MRSMDGYKPISWRARRTVCEPVGSPSASAAVELVEPLLATISRVRRRPLPPITVSGRGFYASAGKITDLLELPKAPHQS